MQAVYSEALTVIFKGEDTHGYVFSLPWFPIIFFKDIFPSFQPSFVANFLISKYLLRLFSFIFHLYPEMNASIVSEYFMFYWVFRHFHILHI